MTREENIRSILECNFSGFKDEIINVAVNAILDLKDETCEDCISRAELIDKTIKRNSIWLKITDSRGMNLQEIIDELSSIRPKTGHWITTRTFMHDGEYYCDKCKCDAPNNEKWDYCPNCGAKMEKENTK